MFKKEDKTKMNDTSFEYLYNKYLNRIVRYINVQYDIDFEASKDVAHEVFKLLWEKHEELYDEDEKKMLSWLYEAAKRKSWEYNRNKNKVLVDFDWDPEWISNDLSAEYEDLIHIEGFKSIEEKYQYYLSEIKKHLNEKERVMFVLIVEMKLDANEAAEELNISDVNFRVRWHRLRNKLKPIVKRILYD